MKSRIAVAGGLLAISVAVASQPLQARPPKDREASPAPAEALPEVRTVGDMTVLYGLDAAPVDNVGLVVGLEGTGSNPPPSMLRTRLSEEMRKRGVPKANAWLTSSNTALVLVRAFIPPGAQQGEQIDVEVRVPEGSETTSLRGGWLLETDLLETALLGGTIRTGDVFAKAQGPVMISPMGREETDSALLRRGRILGGAVVKQVRTLGLVLRPRYQNVHNSRRVEQTVNLRFHSGPRNSASGVATAKTDEYIELRVDARYRYNIPRYLEIVRNLAVGESVMGRHQRVEQLKEYLLSEQAGQNLRTTARACWQLEGIGQDGAAALKNVLEKSQDPIVRFSAAEALAYLGDPECAQELGRAAREEPAFRVFALTALTSLGEPVSVQVLRDLMSRTSAETRYGAFRALWALDRRDPFLRGESLDDQFYLHALRTDGPPLVHLTRSFRPEVVLFGANQVFQPPLFLKAGTSIVVSSSAGSDQADVTRFSLKEGVVMKRCSLRVADVVRAVVELGGTYPDVVEMLWRAEQQRNLDAQVAIDAIPRADQVPKRTRASQQNLAAASQPARLPNLFPDEPFDEDNAGHPQATADVAVNEPSEGEDGAGSNDTPDATESEPSAPQRGLFGKLFGRFQR